MRRYAEFWRIENGELPLETDAGITLQKGETCHYTSSNVTWAETRTRTTRTNLGSVGYNFRIARGVYYRSPRVRMPSVKEEVPTILATGQVYFTNQRVILDGGARNFSVRLSALIGIEVYSDGLKLSKATGRSPFLLIPDAGRAAVILSALLARPCSPEELAQIIVCGEVINEAQLQLAKSRKAFDQHMTKGTRHAHRVKMRATIARASDPRSGPAIEESSRVLSERIALLRLRANEHFRHGDEHSAKLQVLISRANARTEAIKQQAEVADGSRSKMSDEEPDEPTVDVRGVPRSRPGTMRGGARSRRRVGRGTRQDVRFGRARCDG